MTPLITLVLALTQQPAITQGKPGCATVRGEVNAYEEFVAEIAPGFRLNLAPYHRDDSILSGWVMTVVSSGELADAGDLSFVTPPYTMDNPRHLDTSYGKTADMWRPGAVTGGRFVTNRHDLNRARALLERITNADSVGDFEEALDEMDAIPQATFQLRIAQSRISSPSPEHGKGRIDYLLFDVTTCLPG